MRPMVVLFAILAAACGTLVPVQPPHHSAIVLDPHGRPLDTAEVINSRALHLQAKALEYAAPYVHAAPIVHAAPLAHAVIAAPAAVSHQSRVDVHSSPAVVAHSVVAAPLVTAHAAPLWGAHALAGYGHGLHKRSLGHYAYAAPITVAHSVPAAVSHQSRVDVISSPAVVSHAVAAPVYAHAASVVAHIAPAVVSHQSRVDIRSSPAVVAHSVVAAPVVAAHSAWAGAHSYGSHGLGISHLLKKRSLGWAHAPVLAHAVVAPSAVSHQSRVDVIQSHAPVTVAHAAPIAVAHVAPIAVAHAAPAVSHQSRVDVISSAAHVSPIAHSAVWTAPASHWSHTGLPLWGAHALAGYGHGLHKRSLGHYAYAAPITVAHSVPAAVSHQSRVDVISSPAVVSHAVAKPVYAHAAPVVAHIAPAAVSHQSRVDIRSSPAVVAHSVVAAPVVAGHSAWAGAHAYGSHGLGLSHLLKKRSLGWAHAPVLAHAVVAPSAVSHQSRVDVIQSHAPITVAHAAPIAVAHVAPIAVAHAAPAVSHQSRVDVISSAAHVSPIAHSAVWTAPASHWSHTGLLHSSPLAQW